MKIEYASPLKPKVATTTSGKGLQVKKAAKLAPGIRKGANAIKRKAAAGKARKPGKTLNLMGRTRR